MTNDELEAEVKRLHLILGVLVEMIEDRYPAPPKHCPCTTCHDVEVHRIYAKQRMDRMIRAFNG